MWTSIGCPGSRNVSRDAGRAGACATAVAHSAACGIAISHFVIGPILPENGLSQRSYCDGAVGALIEPDGVAQRAAESFVADADGVAVDEHDDGAEAQGVGSAEMDVDIACPALCLELDLVVLEVAQAA